MKRGNHQIVSEFIGDGEVKKADLATKLTETHSVWQEVAASNTLGLGVASKAGTIVDAKAFVLTAAAAGESMTVDILKNGVSIFTAAIVIDDTVAIRTAVGGTLDAAQADVVADDVFEAVLTYTAGAAPTPMTDTVVTLEIELD